MSHNFNIGFNPFSVVVYGGVASPDEDSTNAEVGILVGNPEAKVYLAKVYWFEYPRMLTGQLIYDPSNVGSLRAFVHNDRLWVFACDVFAFLGMSSGGSRLQKIDDTHRVRVVVDVTITDAIPETFSRPATFNCLDYSGICMFIGLRKNPVKKDVLLREFLDNIVLSFFAREHLLTQTPVIPGIPVIDREDLTDMGAADMSESLDANDYDDPREEYHIQEFPDHGSLSSLETEDETQAETPEINCSSSIKGEQVYTALEAIREAGINIQPDDLVNILNAYNHPIMEAMKAIQQALTLLASKSHSG
jgi:hypothetical protein